MKLEYSRYIFETKSNLKFHENPSSESQVVPYGLKDAQTDKTKLKVAFRNF
jgi:hypothetical protein